MIQSKLSTWEELRKSIDNPVWILSKVGGNFAKLSFLFYTSRWWSGMLFFGLWVLYCSRPNRLWIPPIAGWTPQAIPGWIIPIQDWTNSHPMKRIKLICIYFGLLPTLV